MWLSPERAVYQTQPAFSSTVTMSTTSKALSRQLRQLFAGEVVEIEIAEIRCAPTIQMKRLPSSRKRGAAPCAHVAGRLSRTTERHLPVAGEQAARSMVFCSRSARRTRISDPSFVHCAAQT